MIKYLLPLKKAKIGALIILISSFLFFNMQNTYADDDIRIHEYIADGFDLPVSSINNTNYGFEYSQPWSITGGAPFSTLHPGIDINTTNDCGREVKASANGIVKYTGNAGGNWGGVILIQHKFYQVGGIDIDNNDDYVEFTTQYAHIAPLDAIAEGDYVYRGQKIGYIAKGNAQRCESFDGVNNPHRYDVTWSAHLHFEVRSDEDVTAANWPVLSRSGTGSERKNRVDAEGYFLPYQSPYAVNYPNEDDAQSLFSRNTENNSEELVRLINLGAMTYTENNANDPNRDNKNHVLTKRQVVEIIANSLYLKENNSLPNDPVQYAVDQGLINATSPQQNNFDEPVKRNISLIVAARAAQVIIEGTVTNFVNCSSSDFQDIDINDISCKYASYLYENNIFDGYLNGNNRRSFRTSYATRDFIADLGAGLLDLDSNGGNSGGSTGSNSTTWTTGAYGNNEDRSETLSISGESSLTVTVSGVTEGGYDYIYIYDANGAQIRRLDGTINESFTVTGSSIRARFTSDGSQTRSGVTVSISSGSTNGGNTGGGNSGGSTGSNSTTWTTGAYGNNEDRSEILSISGENSLTVTISGTTERNYDYIYIYEADGTLNRRMSGHGINVSFTLTGSSIRVRFTSDGSQTRSGVTVSISSN